MYSHYAISDLAQSLHLLMLTTSTGTSPAQPDSRLPYWTVHDAITGHFTIRVNKIEPQPCSSYSLPVSVSSVQFSRSVVSNSLWSHESQHARPPCPSPTPRVHPNSCPVSWWCHPAISSCRPLLLLPPIPPSIRVFSNESTLHMKWPKYWIELASH